VGLLIRASDVNKLSFTYGRRAFNQPRSGVAEHYPTRWND
jgi:hypothetical protein